jgi:two-component system, OmpR family, sensor histidine kinase VicK
VLIHNKDNSSRSSGSQKQQKLQETTRIDIIKNAGEVAELEFKLIGSARHEIEIIFSSVNAFYIQESTEIMQALKNAAVKHGVKIRILTPKCDGIEEMIQKLKKLYGNFDARYFTYNSNIRTKTLVIDKKESLAMEIKEDVVANYYLEKEKIFSFEEIIGLSTYSNSISTVLSYVAIFETLWNETELYEQIKESNKRLEISNEQLALSNEQLKIQYKVQEDFINMAAHELRNPIMPIIGGIGLLEEKLQRIKCEVKNELDMITRNANRLQKLAEDMLQVSRIQAGSCKLNVEKINIVSLISAVISDVERKYALIGKKVPIQFNFEEKEGEENNTNINNNEQVLLAVVQCDPYKISQVLFNILDNALKFTAEGKVMVSAKMSSSSSSSSDVAAAAPSENTILTVSVSDTGVGIDSSIKNTLFEKFVSTSEIGAGIGLHLSRKIIEAHGGRIWAENNSDGNGATFAFNLPMLSEEK